MIQLSYKIYIPLPMYPWISWLKNRRMKCKAGRKSKIISYKVTDTCFQRNNFVKSGNLFRKPLFVNIIIQGTFMSFTMQNRSGCFIFAYFKLPSYMGVWKEKSWIIFILFNKLPLKPELFINIKKPRICAL